MRNRTYLDLTQCQSPRWQTWYTWLYYYHSTNTNKWQEKINTALTFLTNTHIPSAHVCCYHCLQVAVYTRQELNIRITANFLLALAAHLPITKPHVRRYYCAAVQLPSDWLEVARLYSTVNTLWPQSILSREMVVTSVCVCLCLCLCLSQLLLKINEEMHPPLEAAWLLLTLCFTPPPLHF